MTDAATTYALIRYRRDRDGWLDVESFSRATGTHPDLVVRLVALGLLDPERDRSGALWFAPDQLARLARIQRLRAAFSVNYAALGLVLDLLERVDQLERALRHAQPHRQRHTWT